MQTFCLNSLDELSPYAEDWDRLGGEVPFRSWAWLSTWWHHYGEGHCRGRPVRRLFVLTVFDDFDRLVGIAPWYIENTASHGRVLRPLGSGEVCSDYLSVLCRRGTEDRVAGALADYLAESAASDGRDLQPWDLLELGCVAVGDVAVGRLIEHLADRGNTVHRRTGPNCWRIELPESWEDYLARLSKSHRKQMRRLERRVLDSRQAVVHTVDSLDQLDAAAGFLIDLHQRRRRELGEPGCFASARFTAFHREVMPKLLRNGQLRLSWLELNGRPAAAEYQIGAGGIVYAYQSGLDPVVLDQQPGRLLALATLRSALEAGYVGFDFLRGDEQYKAHWRAEPRRSLDLRVVPSRATARLRHNLWLAGSQLKQWVKSHWTPADAAHSVSAEP